MKLPEFSVKKKVTASMMAMILVVVGLISFTRLGLDFFPDLEFPTVTLVTTYSGASSEDIENTLTKPLEQIVSSVNRVKKVTSTSSEGVSAITAEFEWGTNLDFAAQDVRDQISMYEQYLPEEAASPIVYKFNFSQFPIVFYGVTANRPIRELKDIVEDEIAPRLERIDGVAAARVFSTDEREIRVDVDRAALEARGLTLDRILLAVGTENVNMPAGNLTERHTDLLIRTVGEYESLDDLRRTVIGASTTGEPVYLADVAEVRDTLRELQYRSRLNKQGGVYLIVNKRSGANTALTGDRVNAELERLKTGLPADIVFHTVMDQSDMVRMVTANTTGNAWMGGILAIVLIFLFLRNWRPTFIIGLAIPLSIVTTFIAFYAAGYTLNMLTLGGLALGVGMLVDNAIVVIENIFRHLEEGEGPESASSRGASEVGMAITASTLTTIVVFLPMVFASGITGKLTRGLALSITFSLLSSLFVALTVVPLMSSLLYKSDKSRARIVKAPEERQFAKPRAFYRRILEKVLWKRRYALVGTLVLFVIALALTPFLGTEFMPSQDQEMIIVKVKLPVGTDIEETDRVVRMAEEIMLAQPEFTILSSQIGSSVEQDAGDAASGMANTGPHEALLWAGLTKQNTRKLSDKQLLEKVRGLLPKLENVKFEAIDMSQSMMGGSATPIEIKVFGQELDTLRSAADAMVARIQDVPGLRDLTHSMVKGKPEYRIRIDRDRAYRLGLSVAQVANTVQTATVGRVASRYREGSDEIDIRIRFQERYRDSMDEIRRLPLVTPQGGTVTLDQVADIERGEGPTQIARENQARRVNITANIADRDLGSIVKDIRARLAPLERQLPPGYFMEYGGSYEQMQEAFLILFGALALAALLIYMVMASQFEHFIHPFIIMFTIPLAYIGVVLALFISGKPINLPVFVGIIILAGIAVNNGIVMIDYMNQLIRSGMDKREAVLRGATTRLRPVLLTALTTILGLVPMAFATSSGSEFRGPMGITVLGGLTATTFLTLFFVPAFYCVVNKIRFRERKKKTA